MEEKRVIKISLSTLFLILAVIVMIIMAYFIYKFYNEKTIETEKVSNLNNQINRLESTINQLQGKMNSIVNTTNTDNYDNNEKTKQIIQFLTTSDKVISTSAWVGAETPDMYYFTGNGRFAYMGMPYFTKEGQTISSLGTWEIKDNNLVLNIQQEKKVKGGKMVEESAIEFEHLEDYTEELSQVAYTKKYEIKDFIKDEEKTYNIYYLKLDEMELFQLNYEDEAVNELRNLAIYGCY